MSRHENYNSVPNKRVEASVNVPLLKVRVSARHLTRFVRAHRMETGLPAQRPARSLVENIKFLAAFLERHDHLDRERRRTARVAERCFGPRPSWKCALCGRAKPEVPRIGRAHIVALEEGGSTDQANLIPLCEGTVWVSTALARALDWYSQQTAPSKLSFVAALGRCSSITEADMGCHKLFDSGLISRSTIREVHANRPRWGAYRHIRDEALNVPLADLASEFNPTSARARGVQRLSRQRLDSHEISEDWCRTTCRLISAARRLADDVFLSLARNLLAELDRVHRSRPPSISTGTWSLFFYEKAMVLMVKQPRPDLAGAILALGRSCKLARQAKDDRGYAMSRLEWVHANTFASRTMTAQRYRGLVREQDEARRLLGYKGEPQTADEKRWAMNYLMHRAQLQIKARRTADARQSVAQARNLREQLTVATGWAQFQAVHLNTIEGAILALDGDYTNALRLLARALIPMKSARGKRPEGYLDVARCAAWVLIQARMLREGVRLRAAVRNLHDGRSGFWPL